MGMKKILLGVISILFLIGCSAKKEQNSSSNEDSSNNLENSQEEGLSLPPDGLEVIAENLNVPWSIENLEDTFYLTERSGSIIRIENGEVKRQDVELEQEVSTASEAGLLGFVFAPDFAESNQAYAYYTYENGGGQYNRIVTLQLEDNVWKEENLLLDEIPSGTYHHGGRLKSRKNSRHMD